MTPLITLTPTLMKMLAHKFQGDVNENTRILESLRIKNPEKGYVLNAFIALNLLKTEPRQAINYLEKALKAKPSMSFCWVEMTIAYWVINKFREAWACYDVAKKLYPGIQGLEAIDEYYTKRYEYECPGFF